MTSHSKQSSLDRRNLLLGGTALAGATIVATGTAFGQSNRFDALANLPFEENRPTPERTRAP
jgi:hypothetical protein